MSYHRPAVNKRKVWGDLVPWGQPWRAGANENTTLSASTPFTFGGKAVLQKSGDAKGARENYEKALAMAPEDQKKRISGEIAKLK